MKKLFILVTALVFALNAGAQEVVSYDSDSIDYYNGLYNPNDYAKAPIKGQQQRVNGGKLNTSLNMGTSFGSMGSSEFINPTFNYQATNKLQLSLGFGMAYSNMKFKSFDTSTESLTNHNIRALTNYYSAAATYQASERLQLNTSLIYFQSNYTDPSDKNHFNRDAYMATFGATYQITPSFSVGFEVRSSQNVNPFAIGMSPYGF